MSRLTLVSHRFPELNAVLPAGADLLDPESIGMTSDGAAEGWQAFGDRTLLPLFHYQPSVASYEEDRWQAYLEVNRRFRDAILRRLRPGDRVWIIGHPFLMLPGLLRESAESAAIGFFLPVPFPTSEMFRLLPSEWRTGILRGMLGADLAGFQTHDQAQHFLRSVQRTLRLKHRLGDVPLAGRQVRTGAFPMGIDFRRFMLAESEPAVLEAKAELSARLAGRRVVSAVGSVDSGQGLLQALEGFGHFLDTHPEWQDRVALILAAEPPRHGTPGPDGLDGTEATRQAILEAAARINARHGGGVGRTPVLHRQGPLSFAERAAIHGLSDASMAVPVRDGMSLEALEYLACRQGGTGVLILSETSGAVRDLGEALPVNPNHKGEIALAIHRALVMPTDERMRRLQAMAERIRGNDSRHWAGVFLAALEETRGLRGPLVAAGSAAPEDGALVASAAGASEA
jgi:trehalose 6-phosphate synthase/phosphatase